MKYVIYTKGERGATCLAALAAKKLIPVLCVSEKDDKNIKDECLKHKISYAVEDSPKKASHVKFVHGFKPDLLVCAGYSKILPEELFITLPLGGINCHGGKLPEYRGASPIPWQIINGEKSGEAYVLKLTKGVDDGPILASGKYKISDTDTARNITDKVLDIFEKILPDVVKKYSDGKTPKGKKQNEKNACRWTRRYPEDGLIRWDSLTAKQAVNLIRALDDPYPGAFIMRNGEKIIVTRANPHPVKMAGIPGRAVGKTTNGFLVLALDGAVEILSVRENGTEKKASELSVKYGENFV